MILYDENGEFLGISSETVSFLGYEDVNEFLSLYSDFADLLVEKEGKIYKFKNFSWIDFILYSGAPNKAAVVTMKDGSEVDIRLTVKEIILAKEIGGIQKCYGVRIISDQFVKIASKVNSKMKFEVSDKKVSLSNLLNDTTSLTVPEESKVEEQADKELEDDSIILKYEDEKKEKEKEKEDETSLNFDFPPAQELKNTFDSDLEVENINSDREEKVEFDFNSIEDEKDSNQELTLDFSKKDEDVEDEIDYESATDELNFLKIDNSEENSIDTQDDKKSSTNSPDLAFLKIDESDKQQEEEVSSSDAQAFLKITEEQADIVQNEDDIKTDSSNSNLDFLKIDTQDSQSIEQEENKVEVIKQIQSDIKEIDKEVETEDSDDGDVIIKSGDFIRKVFS